MSDKRIKIQIRGVHQDRELVRLPSLISELSAVQTVLRRLDRLISRSNDPATYFRITTMRYASPALVEIEGVPVKPSFDISESVIEKFLGGLQEIRSNRAPIDFDYGMLDAYRGIGMTLNKGTSEILISSNGSNIELKDNLTGHVKEILGEDEVFQGTVSGILEWINIHEGANQFHIYPVAGPLKIECFFPTDLFDLAIKSVNQYVAVSGRVRYHQRAEYPYSVDIDHLDVYPEESELPTLLEIRGIAKDATGGIRSEEFVSAIRADA